MLQTELILAERYQLKQPLGNNQGRETWLAFDLFTNNKIVIKLLALSPQMQWEELKLFEREAQILQQLDYPKIPRYRDSFSRGKIAGNNLSGFALVQDYIPGTSLAKLLEQGRRFSETEVKNIAIQILEILIYLQEQKSPVLHRDIKPSNIILGENKQVYLVDFGAVQNKAAVTGVTFTSVGTVGYAPLEQFWGKATPASDLYGLGATLVHLLTGIAPADLPQEKLRLKFADKTSVSPSLVGWVEAAIAPDPHQRYQRADQALADLQAGRYLGSYLEQIDCPFGSRVQLWRSAQELKIEILAQRPFIKRGISIVSQLFQILLSVVSLFSAVVIPFILTGMPGVWISFFLGSFLVGTITVAEVLAFLISSSLIILPVILVISLVLGAIARKPLWLLKAWLSNASKASLNLFVAIKKLAILCNLSSKERIDFNRDFFSIRGTILGLKHYIRRGKTAQVKDITSENGVIYILSEGGKIYDFGYCLRGMERAWLRKQIIDWLTVKIS